MWDLDGCLLDSRPGIKAAMCRTFEKFGVAYEESELDSTIGVSWAELFPAKFKMPANIVDEAVSFCRATYMDGGGMRNTKKFRGMVSLLADIRRKQIPQCVVTAKPQKQAHIILKTHNLVEYFEEIHGAELTKGQTKAEMIRDILLGQAVENPRDAVMVDDRASGILAAKEAGVVSVGIMHGYAEDGELEAARPDHLAKDATDLRDIILNGNHL